MSIADTLIRLLPTPDYERMRREILLALEEGEQFVD